MESGSESPSGWDKKLSVFSCFLPTTTAGQSFYKLIIDQYFFAENIFVFYAEIPVKID